MKHSGWWVQTTCKLKNYIRFLFIIIYIFLFIEVCTNNPTCASGEEMNFFIPAYFYPAILANLASIFNRIINTELYTFCNQHVIIKIHFMSHEQTNICSLEQYDQLIRALMHDKPSSRNLRYFIFLREKTWMALYNFSILILKMGGCLDKIDKATKTVFFSLKEGNYEAVK